MSTLRATFTPYSHTRALAEGSVGVEGHPIEFIPNDPIIRAYREMVRDLAYDIAEVAPTTYLMARAAGVPRTAIPVFTKRQFHHGDILCNPLSGIRVPTDLVKRRVGVRAYSVTTGVWVRGLLADDFGIDCDAITWVTDDEEHVASYVAPANVTGAAPGESLVDLLGSGGIDAALTGNAGVGRKGAPRAGWRSDQEPVVDEPPYRLFGTPEPLERDWYARTGIYPIHGVITLRQDVVDANPDLPTQLYAAFCAAKKQAAPEREDQVREKVAARAVPLTEDALPYGVEANERSLTALMRYATDQHLLAGPAPVDSLFAAGDYPTA